MHVHVHRIASHRIAWRPSGESWHRSPTPSTERATQASNTTPPSFVPVSYTHLRAHETSAHL
eukprot:13118734-Alexandrium_andersonii.AAC.1